MILPVAVDGCVLNRLAAVDHHIVSDIYPDMARSGSIICMFKKDDVSRSRFLRRYVVADLADPFRRSPADIPSISAMVDDPAHKAGTVKS